MEFKKGPGKVKCQNIVRKTTTEQFLSTNGIICRLKLEFTILQETLKMTFSHLCKKVLNDALKQGCKVEPCTLLPHYVLSKFEETKFD